MVYTLTLNPALDYVMQVKSLGFGEINRAEETELRCGGKGINVSAVLNELGVDNTALGFAAGFTGSELLRLLSESGIKNDFIFTENGATRINVKIRTGQELDINAGGFSPDEGNMKTLFEKLDSLIKNGDWLVLSGSLPKGVSASAYADIMKMLSDRDAKIAVDTEGDALLEALEYSPFVIKPNHIELGELFGKTVDGDVIPYANELRSRGAKNVLVSMAERGAVLVDENDRTYKSENAEGELVNSVGCGDSMLAGFIAGYIKTGDYENALRLATACGNATAYSETLATKDEIEKYYK